MKDTCNNHEKRLEHTKLLISTELLEGSISFLQADLGLLAETCNGCGAADSKWDFIPDHILGSYVGYACFIHDWDYYTGKTKQDKVAADKKFKRNLLALVKLNNTNKFITTLKYGVVCIYYLGVKKFGSKSFWKNK